jgi:hypothetical protein
MILRKKKSQNKADGANLPEKLPSALWKHLVRSTYLRDLAFFFFYLHLFSVKRDGQAMEINSSPILGLIRSYSTCVPRLTSRLRRRTFLLIVEYLDTWAEVKQ